MTWDYDGRWPDDTNTFLTISIDILDKRFIAFMTGLTQTCYTTLNILFKMWEELKIDNNIES